MTFRNPAVRLSRRWRQVIAGLAAFFSGQMIGAAGNIILVPVYLAYWPLERYGEWLALSSLVTYLATLDLGMSMAGGNRLAQDYARDDLESYRVHLRSALAFYISMAALATAFLAGVAWLLPIHKLLGLHVTGPNEAAIVVFLIGVQVVWSMPAGFTGGIYRSTGDVARSQWVRNAKDIAMVALTPVCLLLGGGMITLATMELFVLGGVTCFVLFDLSRRLPALMPGLSGAKMSVVRTLGGSSLHFGLITLAQIIAIQGPVLLISSQLGGAAVAVFVNARTLANFAKQMVTMVGNTLWPHITAIEARGQQLRVRLAHRLWVVCSIALGVSVAAALWFEGTDVIRVWTRGKLTPDPLLLRLLLLQLLLQVPWQASGLITAAASRHGRLSQAYLWSSIAALVFAVVLIGRPGMGIHAVPVGGIIAEFLFCYHFVTRDTCLKIGESYGKFAAAQWSYLGVSFALALLVAWVLSGVAIGIPPFRWAEVGAGTLAASLATLCLVGLGADDRRQLRRMLTPAAISEPA